MIQFFKKSLLFIFLSLLFTTCYKEELVFAPEPSPELALPAILTFNGISCVLDAENKTLRYTLSGDSLLSFSPFTAFQKKVDIQFDSIKLVNESINYLGAVSLTKKHTITITTEKGKEQLTLEFTNLPIIQVITLGEIQDEPKELGRLIVLPAYGNKSFDTFIGIETRGGSSQHYDKKSFGFTLLTDLSLNKTTAASLLNFKPNTQWILDALFVDLSKMRKKISSDLWFSIKKSNEHHGVQMEFVELYINNSHQGVYCLSENINGEFLGFTTNESLLYKSYLWEGTTFDTPILPEVDIEVWSGWEQVYPHPKERISWSDLTNLYTIVAEKDDDYFRQHIEEYINLENFIDYYLFKQLISASDNYGKNLFLMKRAPSSPFSIIPWDLDATWGRNWLNDETNVITIFTNKLFQRLIEANPAQYRKRMKDRWHTLRSAQFSEDNLSYLLNSNLEVLTRSNIMEIENRRWQTSIHLLEEKVFIENWLSLRLSFLDEYFNEL